jgi:hypothetical protein
VLVSPVAPWPRAAYDCVMTEEDKIKHTKWHKYIYHYIRYSLIIFLVLFFIQLLFLLIYGFDLPQHIEYVEYFVFGIFITIFPAFMILPGIIHEGKFKTAWHGFTLDKFRYDLFLGLTLGLGPTILFFCKYDTLLKEYFKKNGDNIKNKS